MNHSQKSQQQLRVLISMYLGYGAIMISRQMVTILGPAMLADPMLKLTKTNLGDFAAYGTIGALVGKFFWGPLSDKYGGRPIFLMGIAVTALLVIAFGFSPNILSFTIFSVLVYGVKSAGWPGMTKIVGNWFHPHQYGKTWGILATSSRASVVFGTLFFGWLLSIMHWRYVALSSAVMALVICLYCYFSTLERPTSSDFVDDMGDPDSESKNDLENLHQHPLKEGSLGQALLSFIKSRRVLLAIVMVMLLTCLMAFLDFVSLYLMEVYKLTPSEAAVASSVFPAGSLAGLLVCIFFFGNFSKQRLRRALTIMLGLTASCIITLKFLPSFGFSPAVNFYAALSCIFLFGASISPAYYIPSSIFSVEYGGPHSATLVCFIDAFGFAASATFGFIGGRLADSSGGWDSFMNFVIILVMVSILAVWVFLHSEYRAAHENK